MLGPVSLEEVMLQIKKCEYCAVLALIKEARKFCYGKTNMETVVFRCTL